jgi:hypothetical protein
MDRRPWTLLLGQMIAAGGLECMPARISWPLHTALKDLYGEAGRRGLLASLPSEPQFEPAPEAGLRAQGADEALASLCRDGVLRRAGQLADAALEVDAEQLVPYRRSLMSLDPETVRLVQRAGSRWAALASAAAKNAATPATSSGATEASLTASRHEVVPALQ